MVLEEQAWTTRMRLEMVPRRNELLHMSIITDNAILQDKDVVQEYAENRCPKKLRWTILNFMK